MFRTKTNPLHEMIQTHQTNKLVDEIKQNSAEKLQTIDSSKRNLLQLAASKGLVKTVLWLLYAGVDVNSCQPISNDSFHPSQKTPLFCALDAGQGLTTQILLIFNADLNLTKQQAEKAGRQDIIDRLHQLQINPLIHNAVLLWGLINFYPDFGALSCVKNDGINWNNEIHFSRLIELALNLKRPDAVSALVGYQCDANNVSKDFWSAKTELQPLDLESNETIVRRLQELKKSGEKSLFSKYFHKASAQQVQNFLSKDELELDDEKMSATQKNILNAAMFDDLDMLQVILPTTQKTKAEAKYQEENPQQDFFVVLDWMVSKHNFVGLKTLVDVLGIDAVFKYAIENQKQELFFYMMFFFDRYTYECVHAFPEQAQAIIQMTSHLEEFQGLIYRMVDYGVASKSLDLRSAKEISVQQTCFQLGNIDELQFLSALFKCLQMPSDPETLSPPMKRLATEMGKRFGLNLERNISLVSIRVETYKDNLISHFFSRIEGKNHTSLSPNQITLDFLTLKDKARLACVSTDLNKLCTRRVSTQIDSFLTALQKEINRKSYCDRRSSNLSTMQKVTSANYIIASLVLVLSAVYLKKAHEEENDIMFGFSFVGTFLSSVDILVSFILLRFVDMDFHLKLCVEVPTLMCQGLFAGKERFDKVTMADFSDELQIKYQKLLKDYAGYPGFSLQENSCVGEIREKLAGLAAEGFELLSPLPPSNSKRT